MSTKRDYRANVPPNPLSLQETMTLCRYFEYKMYSRSNIHRPLPHTIDPMLQFFVIINSQLTKRVGFFFAVFFEITGDEAGPLLENLLPIPVPPM